jgi:tetratricopeptide (TPR) repeat protein
MSRQFISDLGGFYKSLSKSNQLIYNGLASHLATSFPAFRSNDNSTIVVKALSLICGVLTYHKILEVIKQQAANLEDGESLRIINFACGIDPTFSVVDYICTMLGIKEYEYVGVDKDSARITKCKKYFGHKASYFAVDASDDDAVRRVLINGNVDIQRGFNIVRLDQPDITGSEQLAFMGMLTSVIPLFANQKASLYVSVQYDEELTSVLYTLACADGIAYKDPSEHFCSLTSELAKRHRDLIDQHGEDKVHKIFIDKYFRPWFQNQNFSTEVEYNKQAICSVSGGAQPVPTPYFAFQVISRVRGLCFQQANNLEVSKDQCLKQAPQLYKEGEYAASLQLCESLINNGSQDAGTYFNAGRCCVQLGKFKEGLSFLEKAVALVGEGKKSSYQVCVEECQGLLAYEKGEYSSAEGILQSVIKQFKEMNKAESRYQVAQEKFDNCRAQIAAFASQRITAAPATPYNKTHAKIAPTT